MSHHVTYFYIHLYIYVVSHEICVHVSNEHNDNHMHILPFLKIQLWHLFQKEFCLKLLER